MLGPVSIGVEAGSAVFLNYKSGIIDSADCGKFIDHGVLAVGYDTDSASGKEYILVKNSWGTTWGDNGYLKIALSSDNICGILSIPSYPKNN